MAPCNPFVWSSRRRPLSPIAHIEFSPRRADGVNGACAERSEGTIDSGEHRGLLNRRWRIGPLFSSWGLKGDSPFSRRVWRLGEGARGANPIDVI